MSAIDIPEFVEIDRAPPTWSRVISLLAGTVAFGITVVGYAGGLGIAAVGMTLLGMGLLTANRRSLGAGAVILFLGVVLAATRMTSPVLPLLGTVAAVVAWDAGDNGITIGRQLGASSPTARAEAVHVGATAAIGLVASGVTYAIYQLASENQPLPALVLLLFAVIVLTSTLRD
ncbi:MAG: hypothetical protein ABEI52_06435 [Halobacteriaceae archaeon]